jgi:hypothetical protein
MRTLAGRFEIRSFAGHPINYSSNASHHCNSSISARRSQKERSSRAALERKIARQFHASCF